MAARTVKKSYNSIVGHFPSLKLGRMVNYSSTIELDLLYLLEFDREVTSYAEQPFTIELELADGKLRRYTPDFQVLRQSAFPLLVECKPAARLGDEHTLQQVEIGRKWAAANNHDFQLVSDNELRAGSRLANLKLLWRYSRLAVQPVVVEACCTLLVGTAPLTIAALAEQVSESLAPTQPVYSLMPTIYHLLWKQVLAADLTTPLTGHTLVLLASAVVN